MNNSYLIWTSQNHITGIQTSGILRVLHRISLIRNYQSIFESFLKSGIDDSNDGRYIGIWRVFGKCVRVDCFTIHVLPSQFIDIIFDWFFMLGELVPCGGGDPIPLLGEKLLVGRRTRCDITLQFPNVSSHHCELEFLNGFWRIRDLGSRNGIKVNGKRCDVRWLMPKDVVSIAKHKYEVEYEPDGTTPPAEDENPFVLGLLEKAGLEPAAPSRSPKRKSKSSSAVSSQPASISQSKKIIDDDDVAQWLSEDENV